MTTNTGGPAFPALPIQRHLDTGEILYQSGGMTLRDYFAAKALLVGGAANKPPAYDDETRARQAYELADAMLSARSTEKAREQ